MTTQSTASQAKPFNLRIVAPGVIAFAQAAVHIRNGYIFLPDAAPEIMAHNGTAVINLVLGTPEQYAVEAAEASTAEAVALQQVAYDRDVQEAAKQMVEAAEREATKKKLAAEIEVQRKAIRKLEAALAA